MNEAATNRPLRANTEAWEIYQKMVGPVSEGCLEKNREGGDVDYVTFELKRPGYIQPTVSNPVAA